eukprot:964457-Rhodomonas_salina.1
MEAQKETIVDCSEKETSPLLKVNFGIAKPSGQLRYAPTAFLREFDVGQGRAFPKAEWQVWANQSLCLPNPHVTNHVKIGIKNCKCGRDWLGVATGLRERQPHLERSGSHGKALCRHQPCRPPPTYH